MEISHYYLIHFQYLGFRYHGWQRQPGVKTVQEMVERTFRFIFDHDRFKVLSAGRTDARVSAEDAAFELFLEQAVDPDWLFDSLNENLPNDIRVLGVKKVSAGFNIIQSPHQKEYVYLFSFGEKNHPFCAPLMVYMEEDLAIDTMIRAARLFEGKHDFSAFSHKPGEKTITYREVIRSEITKNDLYSASFFPVKSWVYRVRATGFLRHQVRLMMGALFAVGKGELSAKEIISALEGNAKEPLAYMAPQSGLILYKIDFGLEGQ